MAGGNANHPVLGCSTKVEPIRKKADISTIKRLLADRPRDLALFTLGINTNLRASDLLRLRVGQVRGVEPNDHIEIKERKTGKARTVTLNGACVKAIEGVLASDDFDDEDYLFKSQRSPVLSVPSVHRLVKGWCRQINLKGNFGSHTLRKTWGYHQRVTFGVDLPRLMVCFNHSTQRQTLDYLCIQPEEIRDVFINEL